MRPLPNLSKKGSKMNYPAAELRGILLIKSDDLRTIISKRL